MQCPLQRPDDKTYHGFEYGCRDHVIFPLTEACLSLGSGLHVSDLSLHMARSHRFCGARGASRIDPVKLANVLGCGPESPSAVPGLADLFRAKMADFFHA